MGTSITLFRDQSPQAVAGLLASYTDKDLRTLNLDDCFEIFKSLGLMEGRYVYADGTSVSLIKRPFPWLQNEIEAVKRIFSNWPVNQGWEKAQEELAQNIAGNLSRSIDEIKKTDELREPEKGAAAVYVAINA